jgi:hypothetical protein
MEQLSEQVDPIEVLKYSLTNYSTKMYDSTDAEHILEQFKKERE